MKKAKKFKWVIELEVDELWVADGYEARAEDIQEAILSYSLGCARYDEVKVKILEAPTQKRVDKAQGYQK